MNYLGSPHDPITLAHESGHMWQGYLAADEHGILQFHPPMGVAEIASIINERVVFEHLLKQAALDGDRPMLALLMEELGGLMNKVMRQLCFSEFERYLHGHDGANMTRLPFVKRSAEELSAAFLKVTEQFYGPDGEVFSLADTDHTWAMIPHFHSPFYVHVYASSKLIVGAIFSRRDAMGEEFVPAIVSLLTASGTKDLQTLLQPFGLNPTDPEFWNESLRDSLRLLEVAEAIATRLGYSVP
jgi:oligoendopeptidase F